MKLCILTICLFILLTSAAYGGDHPGSYTSWGIDEYEFFGLTKAELARKFKGKLCFEEGYDRVHFAGPPNSGCRGYLGPTFKLRFTSDRVSFVQAKFEGCKDNFIRPEFTSKKDALKYAITGLSSSSDARDKQKLRKAQRELADLEIKAK